MIMAYLIGQWVGGGGGGTHRGFIRGVSALRSTPFYETFLTEKYPGCQRLF